MTEVRVSIDANGAWRLVRTVGAATQTSVSAAGTAVAGSTYHVVPIFPSNADHRLVVNGEEVTLSHTGAAINAPLAFASTDEIAIGNPTRTDLAGFAGDLGRVVMWPLPFSAQRARISYRQQNDLAQWTGTSGENSSGDTNQAPAAVPVNQTVTAGTSSTIDVISRAHDPNGDALSIVSGSLVPSTGTATIASGSISWTPASAALGPHTVGFSLRDGGGKSSTSQVYGTVLAGTGPDPEPPTETVKYQTGYASVAASKIRAVGWPGPTGSTTYSASQLQTALNAASPGDYVVLEDGTYSGNFTLSSAGTTASKVHVRSRNHLGATLSGKLSITAQHTWVTGLRFTYKRSTDLGLDTDYPVLVSANNVWMTNCFFDEVRSGIRFIYISSPPMNGCKLNYCTLTTGWPSSWAHATLVLVYSLPGDNPGPSNFEWGYNFLHDGVAGPSGANERHAFSVQSSQINGSTTVVRSFVMHHNFTRGNFARHIYNKRHGTMEYNVSLGTSGGQFGFRHGNWNVARGNGGFITGNYVRGPYMIVNGGGAIINGNRFGSGDEIRLFSGSDVPPVNQAADNTTVIDHVGPITVGYGTSNGAYGGTVSGYQNFPRGGGGYPVITPISPDDLVNVAGCDGHRATQ